MELVSIVVRWLEIDLDAVAETEHEGTIGGHRHNFTRFDFILIIVTLVQDTPGSK